MTRDEAASLLADIPQVKAIEVASLKPGDVIVVECDAPVSQQMADRIHAFFQGVWPGQKAIMLEKGLRMRIVKGNDGH